MKRLLVMVAIVGAAVLIAQDAMANCGDCGAKKKTAQSCSATSLSTCAVNAALAKMDLTDAQKTQLETARKDCAAALEKASCVKCPKTSARSKQAACDNYVKAAKQVLTTEQQTQLDSLLSSSRKACSTTK